MAELFAELTAHTRAPARRLWKKNSSGTSRAEIMIYEVLAEDLDEG